MAKRFWVLCLLLLILALPFRVAAASTPSLEVREGNTYLGVFMVAEAPLDYLDFWEAWKISSGNLMLAASSGLHYWAIDIPDGAIATLRQGSGETLIFECSEPVQYLDFNYTMSTPRELYPGSLNTLPANTPFHVKYYVSSAYRFDSPSVDYDFIVEPIEGELYLEDDLGEAIPPEEPEDGGILQNILDWLSSFWKKLVEVITDLFVPDPDYLKKWVEEIREAFESKVGGLTGLVDGFRDYFERLQSADHTDSPLKFVIPAGLYAPGSKGFTVDLIVYSQGLFNWIRSILNACIVIYTAIMCWRKLQKIIDT